MLIAFGALWLFLLAVPALADNGPHQAGLYSGTTTDFCAGCHRAHSAASANLLLKEQPGLCYTCHGAGGSGAQTDVQDGTFYSLASTTHVAGVTASGALRGGGFAYALVQTGSFTGSLFGGATIGTQGPTVTTSHHSVDESAQVAWGNGAYTGSVNYGTTVDLACGSCHDPHGNHQYRILSPGPGGSGIASFSFQAGFANGGRVFINDASTKTYTTTNYANIDAGNTSSVNNITTPVTVPATTPTPGENWFGGPNDGSQVAYNSTTKNWYGRYTEVSSQWCATCHTRYNALGGAAGVNSGDAVYTFQHAIYRLLNPAAAGNVPGVNGWLTPAVYNTATPPVQIGGLGTVDLTGTSHGPKCLTCHMSHGTDASMTSVITSQFAPGVNYNASGATQVLGPVDAGGHTNVALGSTLLRLDNRGVCEACHNK